MNSVLALETSTNPGSLALYQGGGIVFKAEFGSERTHNAVIFEPLATALAMAPDLELIVVGTGPGSYTGVRVAIAAALGVSMARDIPLIGWNSLASLTDKFSQFAVVGDARRGHFHYCELKAHRMVGGPFVESAAEISARCAAGVQPLLTTDAATPSFCEANLAIPCAARLAEIAAGLTSEEISALASQPLEPIYLSAPFITSAHLPRVSTLPQE